MLGQVEALEPGLVGEADQLEPVPEEPLRRRPGDVLDVVEDAEGRSGHERTLTSAVARLLVLQTERRQVGARVFGLVDDAAEPARGQLGDRALAVDGEQRVSLDGSRQRGGRSLARW